MLGLESFINNIVDHQQDIARVALQEVVHNPEVVVVVEHVEVLDDRLVGDVLARETHHLVEDRQGVTQGAVSFLGDDVQRLRFGVDTFTLGYIGQVLFDIFDGNALKIKDLTA